MTNWVRNARPVLLVAVGLVVGGSLLGSRFLSGGDPPKGAAPAAGGKEATGPVVLGTVDSDPSPVSLGLPPALQSGEVVKVFVKAGDEVKAGQPLYEFNTRLLAAELKVAGEGVKVALANVKRAKALEDQHQTAIDTQRHKRDAARTNLEQKGEGLRVYETILRRTLDQTQAKEKADDLYRDDPKRYELRGETVKARLDRDTEELVLAGLEKADMTTPRAIAEAEVERCKALVEKARTAIDLCTVKALVPGTVEQVNVGPGDVLGVAARAPAVVLVPAGPRVVRAEVEAEFAHKVGPDKVGREVVIHDHTDPKLTYKGVVRRVGGAFLAKRPADGGFVPNETRVLPVLVEVADPAPPGKPPLRVGQRVKVNFGA